MNKDINQECLTWWDTLSKFKKALTLLAYCEKTEKRITIKSVTIGDIHEMWKIFISEKKSTKPRKGHEKVFDDSMFRRYIAKFTRKEHLRMIEILREAPQP